MTTLMETTTVNVPAYGQASATPQMVVRFTEMSKKELAATIASHTHPDNDRLNVTFWRALPKETLVIVAADMLATDEERGICISCGLPAMPGSTAGHKDGCPEAFAHDEPADLDDSTQNPEQGVAPETAEPVMSDAQHAEIVAKNAPAFVETSLDTQPAPLTEQPKTVDAVNGYRIHCTVMAGWLRRDQPRKAGDSPTWRRVEDVSKASIYKTLRQAQAKLEEIASLYDDRDHQVEIEAIQ